MQDLPRAAISLWEHYRSMLHYRTFRRAYNPLNNLYTCGETFILDHAYRS